MPPGNRSRARAASPRPLPLSRLIELVRLISPGTAGDCAVVSKIDWVLSRRSMSTVLTWAAAMIRRSSSFALLRRDRTFETASREDLARQRPNPFSLQSAHHRKRNGPGHLLSSLPLPGRARRAWRRSRLRLPRQVFHSRSPGGWSPAKRHPHETSRVSEFRRLMPRPPSPDATIVFPADKKGPAKKRWR